jgi:hypothetical protein
LTLRPTALHINSFTAHSETPLTGVSECAVKELICNAVGRSVKIQLEGANKILHIDTLEAVGEADCRDTQAPEIVSGGIGQDTEEFSEAGQTIYTIVARDDVGVESYAIDGADASSLSVDQFTGNVTLIASPGSATSKSSYEFNVTATDGTGNTSGSTSVSVRIYRRGCIKTQRECRDAGKAREATYGWGENSEGIDIKICFHNPKLKKVNFIQMGEGNEENVRAIYNKYTDWGYQSICQIPTCAANHYVSNRTCTACAVGYTRAAGDPINGGDTTCTVCANNVYVDCSGTSIDCEDQNHVNYCPLTCGVCTNP